MSAPNTLAQVGRTSHRLLVLVKFILAIVDMKGTIARLTDRGFGFITPEDGSKDVFFHAREVKGVQYNDLKEGDPVTFDLTSTDRGPAAANVQKA